eukprot:TRINITY_DN5186_c0_g1_i2.p1 TRINITY_DN5186_c0_g1~~TRINITY_DN5186_c0_g1_i2.p1  ORF type:complete len:141 (-),score=57.07 TRINITY_DN5186_c0_g1_i2:301-723(-)
MCIRDRLGSGMESLPMDTDDTNEDFDDDEDFEDDEEEGASELDAVPQRLVSLLRTCSQYLDKLAKEQPAQSEVQDLAFNFFTEVRDIRTTLLDEAGAVAAWEHPTARSVYGAKMDLQLKREDAGMIRDRLRAIAQSLPAE